MMGSKLGRREGGLMAAWGTERSAPVNGAEHLLISRPNRCFAPSGARRRPGCLTSTLERSGMT